MSIRTIFFATSNHHKVTEARQILTEYQIHLDHYFVDLPEIQKDNLLDIAKFSAMQICSKIRNHIFVEDTGLFINALRGFPGPYSSYVYRTLGNEGIIKLMNNISNRDAYFKTIIVLRTLSPNSIDFEYSIFQGVTTGKITFEKRGEQWGFDPIFEPEEGKGLTYSEMGEGKIQMSHRTKALRALGEKLS